MMLARQGHLEIGETSLEYRFAGPHDSGGPLIVMLHEGLGCVGLWSDFPDRLAEATGAGVFVYSRAGYGRSTSVSLPRPLSYMHDEAQQVLPRVLEAIGFRDGLLLGHSDGASIAAIYAGSVQDPRVRGLVLIAPHFFVEDISIASIRDAKIAYETTDLRAKLARWHEHVDAAFRGWNEAWLDPGFRRWDLSDCLLHIRVPMTIIQGADDQYGTVRQIEMAQETCTCPVEASLLMGVKHAPHRENPEETLAVIAGFFARLFDRQPRT
jgi:pimeloyl-ACP methyl ester carboxylesterase